MEYPATKLASWPCGSVTVCDYHAITFERDIVEKPYYFIRIREAPPGTQCWTCINGITKEAEEIANAFTREE